MPKKREDNEGKQEEKEGGGEEKDEDEENLESLMETFSGKLPRKTVRKSPSFKIEFESTYYNV